MFVLYMPSLHMAGKENRYIVIVYQSPGTGDLDVNFRDRKNALKASGFAQGTTSNGKILQAEILAGDVCHAYI